MKSGLSKVRLAPKEFVRGVEVRRVKLPSALDGQDLTKELVRPLLGL